MKVSNPTAPITNGAKPIVKIAEPCHEKWSDMSNTEKGRFCSMCTKEVVDFTSNTNEEIAAHLKQAEGSVCGRLYTSQVITDTTVSKVRYFFQKSKKYLVTLLAVLSVSAIFGEKADAQCRYPIKGKMKIDPIPEQTSSNMRETTIRGTVTIANTEIPAAMAAIQVSSAGQVIEQTVTNTNGEYKVQLPPGSVQNQEVSLTTSILGYVDKTIDALKVLKDEITLNFSIEEEFMMMGDMLYIPEVKMGEVEYIPEPETHNILSNDPPIKVEELKIIETIPEVQVDVLANTPLPVQEQQVILNEQIMMLGMMVMVADEPEVLAADEELVINDNVTNLDNRIPIESPEIIYESVVIPMGFVELVAPEPHLEITDGPEPIAPINPIDNVNPFNFNRQQYFNPIKQPAKKEPFILVDPFPYAQKALKNVAKIRQIKKISNLNATAFHEGEPEEIVLATQPPHVFEVNEPEAPTEVPEELEADSDEGTRATPEPTAESKIIISLYPNPATDYFTIDLGGEGQYLMEIYDGQGRQIKISKINQSSSRINTATLEPGSYLVRISNTMGDQVETKTIVII